MLRVLLVSLVLHLFNDLQLHLNAWKHLHSKKIWNEFIFTQESLSIKLRKVDKLIPNCKFLSFSSRKSYIQSYSRFPAFSSPFPAFATHFTELSITGCVDYCNRWLQSKYRCEWILEPECWFDSFEMKFCGRRVYKTNVQLQPNVIF